MPFIILYIILYSCFNWYHLFILYSHSNSCIMSQAKESKHTTKHDYHCSLLQLMFELCVNVHHIHYFHITSMHILLAVAIKTLAASSTVFFNIKLKKCIYTAVNYCTQEYKNQQERHCGAPITINCYYSHRSQLCMEVIRSLYSIC